MSNQHPKTPDQLLETLAKLGIQTTTVLHQPVMTVDESRNLRGDIPGHHCKNLFLKDKKKKLWLVVAEEHRDIDLKHLRKRLGVSNLSFGKPDLLFDVLGVTPGSVTPFAVINDLSNLVTVVLDKTLIDAEHVSFHPLTNTQTTTITGQDLELYLRAMEHEPIIIDFALDV